MSLKNIMVAAIATTLLTSGVACAKKKKNKPAASIAPAAKINLAECPDIVGTWTFNKAQTKGDSQSFTFTRGEDGKGPLMFSTNDFDRFVNINGEAQTAILRGNQEKISLLATCKAKSLLMTVKDSKGATQKMDWYADVKEASGMLINERNGKKSFETFRFVIVNPNRQTQAAPAAPVKQAPAAPEAPLDPSVEH